MNLFAAIGEQNERKTMNIGIISDKFRQILKIFFIVSIGPFLGVMCIFLHYILTQYFINYHI